jgi:amidase
VAPVVPAGSAIPDLTLAATIDRRADTVVVTVSGDVVAADDAVVTLRVGASLVPVEQTGSRFSARIELPAAEFEVRHSEWREPYGALVVATVQDAGGAAGAFTAAGGIV